MHFLKLSAGLPLARAVTGPNGPGTQGPTAISGSRGAGNEPHGQCDVKVEPVTFAVRNAAKPADWQTGEPT